MAGIIALGFMLLKKSPVPENPDTSPLKKVELPKGEAEKVVVPPPTDNQKIASAVKNVAFSFAERFGTFTNQSNYENFKDLNSVLTASAQTWLSNVYLPELRKLHDPEGFFYRIITQSRTAEFLEQTDSAVKIKIKTEREETIGDSETKIFNQDLIIELVKANDNWMINGVYWQK